MNLNIFNLQGAPVAQLPLDEELWGGAVNLKILSQAVAMYRTNARAGTASTKTRGDVSGGGKKPWKQKHTGRARAGSTRSPLWRHGGSVFGPRPRDMHYRLPQAIRRRALLESLKGKLQDAQLVVLEPLHAAAPKTKPFAGLSKAFQVARRSVIVLDQPADFLLKSLRNLATFDICRASDLNAFDVLNAEKVLVTQGAFEQLQARVEPPAQARGPTQRSATKKKQADASSN